jgi:hypothetical protein
MLLADCMPRCGLIIGNLVCMGLHGFACMHGILQALRSLEGYGTGLKCPPARVLSGHT